MFACVESAHMEESIWENPRKFLPDRWIDPEGKLIKRDETLGFGAGIKAKPYKSWTLFYN